MEAHYFLNFWRPTYTHKQNEPSHGNTESTDIPNTSDEIDEGEDSFFELELTVPDFDTNNRNSNSACNQNGPPVVLHIDSDSFDSKDEGLRNLANNNAEQHPSLSPSPNDLFSNRKILPIEPISKPQSPISLLKSAPRFHVLMFKKSKSMAGKKTGEAELNGVFVDAPKSKKQQDSKLFAFKFKLEESADVSMLTRENSLRKRMSEESLSDDTSKRFSLEVIQKYLKLIKPLYNIKVPKRQNQKMKYPVELPTVSPSSSPAAGSVKKEKQGNIPAGIRVVCRRLGKSKSASATAGVMPGTSSRRDDSMLLQHDGIQSAILHCKNSFHSSRDSSPLSRFGNDALHEKSMTSPVVISNEGNATN